MQLRFPLKDIQQLSDQYLAELGERDTGLTTKITTEVFPAYRKRGRLTKPEFAASKNLQKPVFGFTTSIVLVSTAPVVRSREKSILVLSPDTLVEEDGNA